MGTLLTIAASDSAPFEGGACIPHLYPVVCFGYFRGPLQCSIKTGIVMDCSTVRLTPPRRISRKREWP
jgi:hypothetical protein